MTLNGGPALVAIFIFLATPIAIATFVVGRVSRFAHRKKHLIQNVIIAEYEPPANLSAAEMGYLFDSRINKTEIIATLVSLEQRGLVSITESKIDGLHVEKVNTQIPTNLKPHEAYLLNNLDARTSFVLYHTKTLMGFKNIVIKSLRDQGLIKPAGEVFKYYAKRTSIAYLIIAAIFMALLVSSSKNDRGGGIIVAFILLILGFPFFFGLALVAEFIYNKLVGQPGIWTDKLKSIWKDIEGYRDYVEQVELDELKFESDDLKIQSENLALPYAIVLNLSTDWQKRF